MSDVLRLGMAGLGVASTQILPPISTLPFIKITAAADTRIDALAKFREAYKGETFTSVEAMCASSERRLRSTSRRRISFTPSTPSLPPSTRNM